MFTLRNPLQSSPDWIPGYTFMYHTPLQMHGPAHLCIPGGRLHGGDRAATLSPGASVSHLKCIYLEFSLCLLLPPYSPLSSQQRLPGCCESLRAHLVSASSSGPFKPVPPTKCGSLTLLTPFSCLKQGRRTHLGPGSH